MEEYFLYTEINQKNGPEGMKGRDTAKKNLLWNTNFNQRRSLSHRQEFVQIKR